MHQGLVLVGSSVLVFSLVQARYYSCNTLDAFRSSFSIRDGLLVCVG
jgi:hypothetical protein